MKEKKEKVLTSIRLDKDLHIAFKKKVLEERTSMMNKTEELIKGYVNERR